MYSAKILHHLKSTFLQVGSEFVEGHVDGFQIFGEKVTDY
jgi:hypothetical protein